LLDAATAQVVTALGAKGVPAVLLKGPVLARWLYGSTRQPRSYHDIDLLVPEPRVDHAVATLRRLGFEYAFASPIERAATSHACVLISSPRSSKPSAPALSAREMAVDLHWTLHGVGALPDAVWAAISADAETMTILDTEVSIPGEAARALHVALHAGAQGAYTGRPRDDLRRALELVDDRVWEAAAELAVRLDAVALFASGLSMEPQGRALAQRIGIESTGDVDARLRARAAPALSFGLTRLRSTTGVRAKAQLIVRELVPTPSFMRVWSPLARRGPMGLALAYAYRPFWLAVKLPGAVAAVAHAARDTEAATRD
jgi:hypothetical protein